MSDDTVFFSVVEITIKHSSLYIIKNIFAQLGYAEKELKTNSTCAKWHRKIPKHDDNLWSSNSLVL